MCAGNKQWVTGVVIRRNKPCTQSKERLQEREKALDEAGEEAGHRTPFLFSPILSAA